MKSYGKTFTIVCTFTLSLRKYICEIIWLDYLGIINIDISNNHSKYCWCGVMDCNATIIKFIFIASRVERKLKQRFKIITSMTKNHLDRDDAVL